MALPFTSKSTRQYSWRSVAIARVGEEHELSTAASPHDTFTAQQERQWWCLVQATGPSSTPPAHAQLSAAGHTPGNVVPRSCGGHSCCTRSSYGGAAHDPWGNVGAFSCGAPHDSWGNLCAFTLSALHTPKPLCGGNPCHAWDVGGLAIHVMRGMWGVWHDTMVGFSFRIWRHHLLLLLFWSAVFVSPWWRVASTKTLGIHMALPFTSKSTR